MKSSGVAQTRWLSASALLVLSVCSCWPLVAAGTASEPTANPFNEELSLVFADEFDGARLVPAVWESQSYDKGLSRDTARGPDNLEVRDGELRLHVRKEERPSGQRRSKWTAGFVYTRHTIENNVLIEVRFKPGQATGVNNQVPEREPFFHANVDAQGNTSVNNDWHLNAKETTAANEVQSVTFANRGTAPLTVRELKLGVSYRSVMTSSR